MDDFCFQFMAIFVGKTMMKHQITGETIFSDRPNIWHYGEFTMKKRDKNDAGLLNGFIFRIFRKGISLPTRKSLSILINSHCCYGFSKTSLRIL